MLILLLNQLKGDKKEHLVNLFFTVEVTGGHRTGVLRLPVTSI